MLIIKPDLFVFILYAAVVVFIHSSQTGNGLKEGERICTKGPKVGNQNPEGL